MGFCDLLNDTNRFVIKFKNKGKIAITKELIEDTYMYIVKPNKSTKIDDINEEDNVILLDRMFIGDDEIILKLNIVHNAEIDKIYYACEDGSINYSMNIFNTEPEEGFKMTDNILTVTDIDEILSSKETFYDLVANEKIEGDNETLSNYGFYIPSMKVVKKLEKKDKH